MTTSDGGSLRERQRQEREQLILRAAEELLLEKGYYDTSIDDIAARVGIAKGTVYLHFASKEDLVIALFDRGMRYFAGMLESTLAGEGTPREKIEKLVNLMLGAMSGTHRRFFSSLMRNPEILLRMREKRERHEDLWRDPMRRFAVLIDEGKASGDFDPTIPTPVLTSFLFNLLSPRNYEHLVATEQTTDADLVHYLCMFFFKGVAVHPEPPNHPESPERPKSPARPERPSHAAHSTHAAQRRNQIGVTPR